MWLSNRSSVMETFGRMDKTEGTVKAFEAEPSASSLLGLQWNMAEDTLEVCRGTSKDLPSRITQRVVLSFVASVFDPLELFAPFTMRMRILLKIIWSKLGQLWDNEVSDEKKLCFQSWKSELQQLKELQLARCYFKGKPQSMQLHIFSDASLEAMCVVSYIRALTENGVEVSFVVGKCRIAPMKQQTIPKLELQAALYSVRMRQLITEGHDILVDSVFHWTDSRTVLQWLKSAHKKQQVFVANRVGEILDHSTVDEWRHVRGALNPADIGTRGMTVSQLLESEWLTGPAWLLDPTETWLDESSAVEEEEEQEEALELSCLSQAQSGFDWTRMSKFSKLT